MLKILRYKNINLLFVFLLFMLYLPQSVYTVFVLPNSTSLTLITCLFLAILTFYFSYFVFRNLILKYVSIPKIRLKLNNLFIVFFLIYFSVVAYAVLTAPKIALVSSLLGGSSYEIANARELLFKSRTGNEKFLLYLYAIFSKTIIPLSILWVFKVGSKLKYILLTLFLFSQLLTLEKALPIYVFFPLIVYFVNTKNRRMYRLSLILLISFLSMTVFLSKSGADFSYLSPPNTTHVSLTASYSSSLFQIKNVDFNNSFVGERRLFESEGQFFYILNRAIWIPFITAYDWVKYQEINLNGEFLYGRSISIVSEIFDLDFINMEKSVFESQFGQNPTETGVANAVYFADAYVNFGYFGVIVSSIFLGFLFSFIQKFGQDIVKAVFYLQALGFIVGSVPPMIFSGGVFFTFLICFVSFDSYSK